MAIALQQTMSLTRYQSQWAAAAKNLPSRRIRPKEQVWFPCPLPILRVSLSLTHWLKAYLPQVAARIRVGGRPVHAYSINQTNTVWSHSDAEGIFYVIAVNNSQNLTVARTVPVSSFKCQSSHTWSLLLPNAFWDATLSDYAGKLLLLAQFWVNLISRCSSFLVSTRTFWKYAFPACPNTCLGPLQSFVNVPAHGKLVVNDALYPLGYGNAFRTKEEHRKNTAIILSWKGWLYTFKSSSGKCLQCQ